LLSQLNKIVCFLFSLAAILCAGVSNSGASRSPDEGVMKRNAAENIFLDGKIAERDGDSVMAMKYFLSAWKLDPASEYLTSYAADFAISKGEPGHAVYVITGGAPYATLSDEKLRFLAAVFISNQYFTEALKVYRELDRYDRTDTLVLADLYVENKQFREAADLVSAGAKEEDSLALFKVADLYRRAGDGAESLKRFRDLTSRFPLDRSIQKGYGLSLLAFGSEQEALNVLTWFLPVSGGIPDNQVMELVGRYYASKGRYKDAIQLFQPLYFNDGSSRDYYYGRPLAIYSFLDGRYEYARNLMSKLLSNYRDDYELHFLQGAAHEALGHVESALASYDTSIVINPSFEEPYRAKVLLYVRSRDTENAIFSAEKYAEKFPAKAESWALWGSVLTMNGRYSDALIPLENAMVKYDGSAPVSVQFEYAMALERSGKLAPAERIFAKLVDGKDIHAPSANYLGYLWAEQNRNLKKAQKLVESALQVDPDNGAYLDSYGWVLYRLKQYEVALGVLEKALLFIKDDYVVYYHLGAVLEKMGRFAEAQKRFEEANSFDNPQKDEIKLKIESLKSKDASSSSEAFSR